MQHRPDALEIPRGDPVAALRAFVIQSGTLLWVPVLAAFHLSIHASEGPNTENGIFVLVFFFFGVGTVSQVRAFAANLRSSTPYVKMDRSGFTRMLPTRWSTPWSDITACACRNDGGRTVLRLFLRGRAQLTRDIDFALAAQPKLALDKAMVACAAWIVAARHPDDTKNPIRDFVVEQPGRSALRPRAARPAKLILWTAVACLIALGALSVLPRRVWEEPPMAVDGRPEQKMLFLGNSRIAVNDMPRMVRDVADSAHSPIRYDIHARAWGAATLREHWNDDGDQALLRKPWTLVILQPQSGAFMGWWASGSTARYGELLIRAAEASGSKVAVMANWALGPTSFSGDASEAAGAAKSYADQTEHDTRALASRAGAGVIDLDGAFAEAAETMPDVAMTVDGNHPSHAGTYLAALVIYDYLSHADLDAVTWRPYDMSKATAEALKRIAARYSH